MPCEHKSRIVRRHRRERIYTNGHVHWEDYNRSSLFREQKKRFSNLKKLAKCALALITILSCSRAIIIIITVLSSDGLRLQEALNEDHKKKKTTQGKI